MARTPLVALRVPDDEQARWKIAARDRGITLTALVRELVNAGLDAPQTREQNRKPDAPAPTAAPGRRSRAPARKLQAVVSSTPQVPQAVLRKECPVLHGPTVTCEACR